LETPLDLPMNYCITRDRSLSLAALLTAAVFSLTAQPVLSADDDGAPRGPAVTVLKAAKYCFNNNVEVSGIMMAREETQVRPEKLGAKVSEIMADAGDVVTAGQILARITPPEGGSITVQAPVAGLISTSSAQIGAIAGGKGDALFTIIARSEYDLIGMVPVKDIARLQVGQPARIKIIGAGEVDGRVRRVAPTIEPNSQLGQVFIGITPARRFLVNASGRALIKTGQSCGIAVPLTSILYSSAGTVVQVVRRARIETRSVETGLMAAGQVEIKNGLVEGDIVVARAGALLREGDPVRPVTAAAEAK
jgi:HlyD family secretion protein